MITHVQRWACVMAIAIAVVLPAPAQNAPDIPADPGPARTLLDSIRNHLVELRFEQALAAIEALLGSPGLTESERGEALILRSQAHVAFGDLAAAEQDYRQILSKSPTYVPDSSLTPNKAMTRFDKARRALIGEVNLAIDPPDARISIDGRAIELLPQAAIPLLAGEHVVIAERDGFDSLTQSLTVVADSTSDLEMQLVPNARTVVVVTEPDGVEVRVDGVRVGETARPVGQGRFVPAQLRIEHLPLGEHTFELSKPCFRTESRRQFVAVDLLDRAPLIFAVTRLAPVSSTLMLRDGPHGSTVRIDGDRTGRLPLEPVEVCPGTHEVEVRRGGRIIWATSETLVEGEERVLAVRPRPNLTVIGSDTRPHLLEALDGTFNVTRNWPLPPSVDLSTAEGWARLSLPAHTDLALARQAQWLVYSPVLGTVLRIDAALPRVARPDWNVSFWGLTTVDSKLGGAARVADVVEAGPAAETGLQSGDRIVSVGGVEVGSSEQLRAMLGLASVAAPLEVSWIGADRQKRQGRLRGVPSARLETESQGTFRDAVDAAWATVDEVCEESAGVSVANLALLLSRAGRHKDAVRAWQRVELPERAGIGRGTVAYYLGRELQRLGREREAVRAYRTAAAGQGTVFDDRGPRVAPAARDRLADLGAE